MPHDGSRQASPNCRSCCGYTFDLQRLRQLIGREQTIYPKGIHQSLHALDFDKNVRSA